MTQFFPASPNLAVLEKYGIPNPATGFNLLSLGRLSRDATHKGYERLLEVFAMVSKKSPDIRLIYGGRGSLIEDLQCRAEVLGIAEKVFFTGMIHDEDLADVYRSAHLFSLVGDRGEGRGEGIPLTPLEAAACGVPILVGNQDGSQEAVIQGENGFILDPFDLEKQAEIILKVYNNILLKQKLGCNASRRIQTEFAYENFLELHRTLLQAWH